MTLEELEAAYLALAAEVADLKTKTPTLEEMVFEQCLPRFNGSDQITGTPAWSFFVAPIKCRVLSVAFFWEYLNVGGGNANYWRLTLQKGNDLVGWADVAQRSTQTTGAIANGGIDNRVAWTFDAATWSDATLLPGHAMRVSFAPFGNIATTAPITFPVTVAGRYTPVA